MHKLETINGDLLKLSDNIDDFIDYLNWVLLNMICINGNISRSVFRKSIKSKLSEYLIDETPILETKTGKYLQAVFFSRLDNK